MLMYAQVFLNADKKKQSIIKYKTLHKINVQEFN